MGNKQSYYMQNREKALEYARKYREEHKEYFKNYSREYRKLKPKKPKSTYVVYKGEDIIGIGTADELAKKLNVYEKTIYWYATSANHRRINKRKKSKNATVAIKVED